VLLILSRFFNFCCIEVTCFLLLDFENLTESSATELFDDLEAAFKNFLAFLKQWHSKVLGSIS